MLLVARQQHVLMLLLLLCTARQVCAATVAYRPCMSGSALRCRHVHMASLSAPMPLSVLVSTLDELPMFTMVNPQSEVLQFSQQDKSIALFFSDVDLAQEQLEVAQKKYPELSLRLAAVGLGAAYSQWKEDQTALLVGGESDLEAARKICVDSDIDWDSGALPVFSCFKLRLSRRMESEGETRILDEQFMPVFLSYDDAMLAVTNAQQQNEDITLELDCTSLQMLAEKMVKGETAEEPQRMQFVAPRKSIRHCAMMASMESTQAGSDGLATGQSIFPGF
mmetsp:Transcript_26257/g.57552  ORF Transcript_26257/g.57552 Transcript_26257/m.57552 type:complete len:279 (-) Transcript_26257:243-1079(-)